MGLQSNYGKLIPVDDQSVPIKILSLVPYAQFWAMICLGPWKGKSSSMVNYPNTWNFGNKALSKMQLTK
jgi:hypothetical protein